MSHALLPSSTAVCAGPIGADASCSRAVLLSRSVSVHVGKGATHGTTIRTTSQQAKSLRNMALVRSKNNNGASIGTLNGTVRSRRFFEENRQESTTWLARLRLFETEHLCMRRPIMATTL